MNIEILMLPLVISLLLQCGMDWLLKLRLLCQSDIDLIEYDDHQKIFEFSRNKDFAPIFLPGRISF